MKKTQLLSLLFFAVVFLCGEPTSFANVNGSAFFFPPAPMPMCGAADGTLYTNLTGGPISFDLSFNSSCTATLSWTDADGQVQTFTISPSESPSFATSLPAGGAISWSTSGIGTLSSLSWTLGTSGGRSQAKAGGGGTCGTSGAAYINLTADPIYFNLAVSLSSGCGVTLSWTDANGQAQEMTFSASANTQGASTSLPPGGVISWALEPGAGSKFLGFDVERAPTIPVSSPFKSTAAQR